MIAPTRRAVLILAAGVPGALLLAVFAPGWWSLAPVYGLLVLAALALDLSWMPRRATVTVTAPTVLAIGGRGRLEVALDGPDRADLLVDLDGPADRPAGRARGGIGHLDLVPRRRGVIALDRLWLRWNGPLGLMRRRQVTGLFRRIPVVPDVRGIGNAVIELRHRDTRAGIKPQTERGAGSEFEALREHLPGMDNRLIDWKRSARYHLLVSKEMRTERNHVVVVGLDTGRLMGEPLADLPRLDHAINAALVLAWHAQRSGDLVGLHAFDSRPRRTLAPRAGVAGFRQLQAACGDLAYGDQEANYTLALADLNGRLNRRALVVLFTDFVDTVATELLIDNVQRLLRRHLVVFVTLRDPFLGDCLARPARDAEGAAAAVLADQLQRERAVVLERLGRLGVHCLDVPHDRLRLDLLNRYLTIKQRDLL